MKCCIIAEVICEIGSLIHSIINGTKLYFLPIYIIKSYKSKSLLLNNFVLCQPDKLTKEDLSNFNKCKPLQKKDITSKNINSSLNKLLTINMPDGGIDTEKFVYNYFNIENITQLNNSLIDLLVHGIIPMNKIGRAHV